MKHIIATATALVVFAAAPAGAESTQISPNGSRPSAKGPAQYFSGSVIVDPFMPLTTAHPRRVGL